MATTQVRGLPDESVPAEHYRAVFDDTGDAVFIADGEGRLLDVNPAAHRALGYSPGELIGRRMADVMTTEDATRLRAAAACLLPGEPLSEECRFVRADGVGVSCPLEARALSKGRWLGVVRGASLRGENERPVRESEALLRSVLETAPDIILTVNREGKILFINRVLSHQRIEEVVGASCFDFVPEHQRERVRAAIEHVFATGDIDEYEVATPVESDKWAWSYVRVGPIVENGRVEGVTMCATNITRLKRAEAARVELEAQLRQAQKEEGIGRLAGGMAHDFNNLLTSILGFASLVERAIPSDSPAVQFAREIALSAQRGAALTQQLLAFARQKVIRPEVVDLNEILRRMVPMLRRLIGEDIELVLELRPEVALVRVDVGSMEQVVLNLVVNARDAMPHGGRLTIETESLAPDAAADLGGPSRPLVMLAVTDTGIGMTPEIAERVFEPFYTTKPVGEGTGLGLPMCQGIVKQAGGQITVTSAPGEGSTFRVYLPRSQEHASPERSAPAEPSPLSGTEDLLLVEDDDSILKMAREVLVRLGYRVTSASDGREALKIVNQRDPAVPFDLVITDVVMPHLGGHELAEILACLAPSTRVLFTSGYLENTIARKGVLREGVDFLQKPYTPMLLAGKIRELLDRPR